MQTGPTKVVDQEGTVRGEVRGVLPVTTALVRFTDRDGKEEVELAILIPGGRVHFLHKNINGAISLVAIQSFLGEAIQKHFANGSPDTLTADKTFQV